MAHTAIRVSFGRAATLFAALSIGVAVGAACSSGHASTQSPCRLLKPSEIGAIVHGHVEAGKPVPAIGESAKRMCSYRVATALRTVTVYLGHGRPPSGTNESPSGATAVRGAAFVAVGAQFPDRAFPRLALALARRAITRVT